MKEQKERKPHVLTKLKKTTLFHDVVFVDTETSGKTYDGIDGEIQEFMLGVAKYVKYDDNGNIVNEPEYLYFDELRDFYDYIVEKVNVVGTLRIYAHNMDFDFSVLDVLTYMDEYGFSLEDFIIDTGNFLFDFSQGKLHLIFTDTAMYFHTSVRQLGNYLKFPKLQMPSYSDSLDKWYVYCQRDVDVIERMYSNYVQFLAYHDLGTQGYTIASQAMHAFRHRFMRHKIHIHTFDAVIDDERASYHGGRTEPFYIGEVPETPIYDLDVNSLYPYVMHEKKYPTRYLTSYEHPTISQVEKWLEEYSMIALCEVETDIPIYPYQAEKLIFPVGHFTTWLNTGEIEEGVKRGLIKDVKMVHLYAQDYIFRDYVEFFYQLKEEYTQKGDKISRYMAKLFMNSLYGKFGQKSWDIVPYDDPTAPKFGAQFVVLGKTGQMEYVYYINHQAYVKANEHEGFDSFVAIASNVTAYARMHLWRLIEKAGIENVYYCDTDSVFVNSIGYERLKGELDEYELGKLKVEKTFEHLIIRAPKDYIGDDVEKLKGVPKSARPLGRDKYEYTQFERFKARLRRGSSRGVLTKKVVKELRRTYDKAVVLDSGRCIPFDISS